MDQVLFLLNLTVQPRIDVLCLCLADLTGFLGLQDLSCSPERSHVHQPHKESDPF